jgi:putative transposase
MSRLRRIADCDRIFFVTTNLLKSVHPFSEEERDMLLELLGVLRSAHGFLLLGYVVMPDHVHLLVACRTMPIAKLMHQWKFKAGYAIQKLRGVHGRLWQPRYFDFICRRSKDVSAKLRYMHQNPVVAGIVPRAEAWRWSSAAHYNGFGPSLLIPDLMDFSGDPDELLWPAPNRPL